MKKSGIIVSATCLIILSSGYFSTLPGAITNSRPDLIFHESFALDTLTIYHPSSAQCDADPFITASNKRININQLKHGKLRWMALSRNMLGRWGGKLNYGDTVTLHANDPSIDGDWIIQDTMNKRFKNRGDLLFDSSLRSTGMWKGVTISKRKKYSIDLLSIQSE